MLENQIILIHRIKTLSNVLDRQYASQLNFRNHCYLRIAYDNTVLEKWEKVVKKPFIKHATEVQLLQVIDFLESYLTNQNKLLQDNERSLEFRKRHKLDTPKNQTTLF